MHSQFSEAEDFIQALKERVQRRAGERGRKYRRIQGSPLKTIPPGVATWMIDPEQSDNELFPSHYSDTDFPEN